MLTSLAAPAMFDWVRRAGFPEAQSQLRSVLEMARADAQRDGTMLRVIAVVSADNRVEVVAEIVATNLASAEPGVEPNVRRLLWKLPSGLHVEAAAAADGSEDSSSGPAMGADGQGRSETESTINPARGSEFVLAIFSEDGTAVVPAPWLLRDNSGRIADARVNGWSGTVRFERRAAAAGAPGRENAPESPRASGSEAVGKEPS